MDFPRPVAAGRADQLHAHWKAAQAEADGHADAWQTRKRDVDHHFHPAVVCVHCPAGDRGRPALVRIERPDLR
jgi:hypothetical protein